MLKEQAKAPDVNIRELIAVSGSTVTEIQVTDSIKVTTGDPTKAMLALLARVVVILAKTTPPAPPIHHSRPHLRYNAGTVFEVNRTFSAPR
jgi:hypothetical protein